MHQSGPGLWQGQEGEAVDDASMTVGLQPGKDAGVPARISRRQHLRSTRLKKAVLSVAAFFLIVVMFNAFCKRLRSTVSAAGLPKRRLAGVGGDEIYDKELQAILDGCLDWEAESNSMVASDGSPKTYTSSSVRMEVVPPHGAESAGSEWASPTSLWPGFMPYPPYATPPVQHVPPFLFFSGGNLGPQLPPAEIVTSADTSFENSEFPHLGPDAWLEQIPAIMSPGATESVAWLDTQESLMDDGGQPSTSVAVGHLSAAGAHLSKLAEHPYVRIPRLGPGASFRAIKLDGRGVGPLKMHGNSTFEMLSAARTLLAKPELDSWDAEALLHTVELIVLYVKKRFFPGVIARPVYELLNRLGMYFLLTDVVLSANDVLGPPMRIDTWWEDFVSHFRIEYSELTYFEPRPGGRQNAIDNFRLLRRLQKNLRIFLERKRPSKEDIIATKRLLFFNKSCHFRETRWEPWRRDDKEYRSQTLPQWKDEGDDGEK
ncbi:hypothetical protein Emag_007267 [Eimeria magna]